MADVNEQASFLSLRGSDSGLTLVNTDALVRKCDQQDRLIESKKEKIANVKEKIEELQDMVETCEYRQVILFVNHFMNYPIVVCTN